MTKPIILPITFLIFINLGGVVFIYTWLTWLVSQLVIFDIYILLNIALLTFTLVSTVIYLYFK